MSNITNGFVKYTEYDNRLNGNMYLLWRILAINPPFPVLHAIKSQLIDSPQIILEKAEKSGINIGSNVLYVYANMHPVNDENARIQ